MKGPDRFLLIIVGAIVVLVIVAFVVVLVRPKPEYRPEDSAEGVAHNYLLALQKGDYERAYGYLNPTINNYPGNVDQFVEDIDRRSYSFGLNRDSTLDIMSARKTVNTATVFVEETTYHGSGPFDRFLSYDQFDMKLNKVADSWRLTDADRYWSNCWSDNPGYGCD
jgi:hypothetical protein